MAGERVVLLVGLTGGIGSGKSVVDDMLRDLGAHVIDADEVVHRLLATDRETIDALRAAFGDGIVGAGGVIDRAALGRIVFHDADLRAVLDKIVHPIVRRELNAEIEAWRATGDSPLVVVDAALMVESGYYREFDRLVVVTASTETRLDRLMRRDGIGRDEALARIVAQLPTEAKVAVADYTIDNDGPVEATRESVGRLHASLMEDWREKTGADAAG